MFFFSLRFLRQNSNMPYCYKGKYQRIKWGYFKGDDPSCGSGLDAENTAYLLLVFLLTNSCTLYDLLKFNDKGHNRTMETEG